MKIEEEVSKIIASDAQTFKNIPPARAAKLVRQVLASLTKEIAGTTEGKIGVAGLGTFVVKQVEREKDGKKTKERRIAFRSKADKTPKDKSPEAKKARADKRAAAAAAKTAPAQASA